MTDEISDAALEQGKFYAAMLPGINPLHDGIELVFVTRGRITWCGLNLTTVQPGHQIVLRARLRPIVDQIVWRPNMPDQFLRKLEPIETQGWFETGFSKVVDLSKKRAAASSTPTPMKGELLLHTSGPEYSLAFLDDAKLSLGTTGTIEYGMTHQYVVRGYLCNMP